VDDWLDFEAGGAIVDGEAVGNSQKINSGVPVFIIQGVHRIDGFQDPQQFVEIFVKVKQGELVAWCEILYGTKDEAIIRGTQIPPT